MGELTEVFKYAGELFSRFFRVIKWNVHYWINKKLREIERKRYHPLICECDNFSRLLRDSSCNSEEQINYYVNRWKSILFKISKKEGYGKKTAKILWENFGIMCNWKHLHQTEDEGKRTPSDWKDEFAWEVFYCCDRWSFERLLRVQWLFRRWEESARLQNSKRRNDF